MFPVPGLAHPTEATTHMLNVFNTGRLLISVGRPVDSGHGPTHVLIYKRYTHIYIYIYICANDMYYKRLFFVYIFTFSFRHMRDTCSLRSHLFSAIIGHQRPGPMASVPASGLLPRTAVAKPAAAATTSRTNYWLIPHGISREPACTRIDGPQPQPQQQ